MTNSASRAVFFVHMLPRFVSDFGALASCLAERGVEVTVFAPPPVSGASTWWKRPEVHQAARQAMSPKVRISNFPLRRDRLNPISLLRALVIAIRAASRWPDAVFFMWTPLPVVLCGLPLRALERKCVFMVTGLGSVFSGETDFRFARQLVDHVYPYLFRGRRSRVIVHNVEDKEFLATRFGVPREHVQVTPGCGVDPAEYPWQEDLPAGAVPVIYAPVRLIREKGVREAVEASALLLERNIAHELWFTSAVDAGNPASLTREDLEGLKRTSAAVRFLGYQPSVMDVYRRCHIVCIPTKYREGLPTAILEAASCGRPIVTTNNVGCREFVMDGKSGLVVRRGNAQDLADALARLIEDPSLADQLRRNAHRQFLEGFTKQVMVQRTLEVVADLTRPAPEGRQSRREPVGSGGVR